MPFLSVSCYEATTVRFFGDPSYEATIITRKLTEKNCFISRLSIIIIQHVILLLLILIFKNVYLTQLDVFQVPSSLFTLNWPAKSKSNSIKTFSDKKTEGYTKLRNKLVDRKSLIEKETENLFILSDRWNNKSRLTQIILFTACTW